MTANHDLERRVADYYATEATPRAPDRVLVDALATIDTTRQRRELRLLPRRVHIMSSYARLAVAAAVVLAVGALGFTVLQPGSGSSGVGSSPLPSPSPSPTPAASPSQLPSSPPLSGTFTSPIHGLSTAYPATWTAAPATESAAGVGVSFLSPGSDFLYDPQLRDHLFIVLWSAALDGQAGEAWATTALADPESDCDVAPQPVTVDGAPGLICDTHAMTWIGDRGYSIRLYVSGDDPRVGEVYDGAWFQDVLETVRLPAQG